MLLIPIKAKESEIYSYPGTINGVESSNVQMATKSYRGHETNVAQDVTNHYKFSEKHNIVCWTVKES